MKNSSKINKDLALVIACTKRKRRPASLIEIAESIESLVCAFGSLSELSERVGISEKMLKQFLSVEMLSPEVIELVKNRTLDSVDAVYHLSRLKTDDQIYLSSLIGVDGFDTKDLRDVLELKRREERISFAEIVNRVMQSKTQKQYVLEFVARGDVTPEKAKERLMRYLNEKSILSTLVNGTFGQVNLNSDGMKLLKRISKKYSMPVKMLLPRILSGTL